MGVVGFGAYEANWHLSSYIRLGQIKLYCHCTEYNEMQFASNQKGHSKVHEVSINSHIRSMFINVQILCLLFLVCRSHGTYHHYSHRDHLLYLRVKSQPMNVPGPNLPYTLGDTHPPQYSATLKMSIYSLTDIKKKIYFGPQCI